jgi:hypothetical protein
MTLIYLRGNTALLGNELSAVFFRETTPFDQLHAAEAAKRHIPSRSEEGFYNLNAGRGP